MGKAGNNQNQIGSRWTSNELENIWNETFMYRQVPWELLGPSERGPPSPRSRGSGTDNWYRQDPPGSCTNRP